MDTDLFVLLLALPMALYIMPKNWISPFQLLLQVAIAAISSSWAISSLSAGENIIVKLPISWVVGDIDLSINPLSGFFILLINLTTFTSSVYAQGYLKSYQAAKNRLFLAWHSFNMLWLQLALLLVVSSQEGVLFLVSWELMSLSSFALVLFEAEKAETLKTALRYLVQMHIGMLFLLFGFIYTQQVTGANFGWLAVFSYFGEHQATLGIFSIFLLGFGLKAGLVPFHSWLPQAHPAAPAHISGLMSGIMIKMGVFGLLKIMLGLSINNPAESFGAGVLLLIFGIITGLYGIMNAIVRKDIKEILAYSSIENIGIIFLGMGLSLLASSWGLKTLQTLSLAGSLLHILNHSLFKSLLFYCAGSIYQQTHTRYIENMGGLIKKMPKTAALALVGCLAICGLPPFNGFVSEYLIYLSLFKSLNEGDLLSSLSLLGVIIVLALIGGLALFAFSRFYSIIFLGSGRSAYVDKAQEVEKIMLGTKFLIVGLILAVGLGAVWIMPFIGQVTASFGQNYTLPLADIAPPLLQVGISGGIFILVIGLLYGLRTYQQKRVLVSRNLPWGCGYDYKPEDVPLHQYTATSYAANYVEIGNAITGSRKKPILYAEEEIFPTAREFKAVPYDKLASKLVNEPAQKILAASEQAAVFQTGSLRHYVLYAVAFGLLILILSYTGMI
jgi:hydrogenase-4 component B